MKSICYAVGLLLAGMVAVASAKGTTTRIVIKAPELRQPIVLHETDGVAQFSVWSGPGTSTSGVEGKDQFIVDWRSGTTSPPAGELKQVELSFYADEGRVGGSLPVYVVSYAVDTRSGTGFVYLPGPEDPRYRVNAGSIVRGPQYEGHWFHASGAFQDVMRTALALSSGAVVVAQEAKPVPKGTVRVSIPGCSRGYVFTTGPRTADEAGSTNVPDGLHLRMNGPKKLIGEIKAHEGSMVVLTGTMKEGQFMPGGVGIGGGVRVGPSGGPGGVLGNPIANQIMIDVEGWRPSVGNCPSR